MARMRAELKEYSPTTFARSTQAGISEISAASDLSDVLRASAVRQGALARDARRNLFVILGWGYVVAIANPIILHWARANEEFWGARWSAVALAFPFPYAQSLLVAVCSLVLTVLAFRTSGVTRITARESRWVIVAAWAGAIVVDSGHPHVPPVLSRFDPDGAVRIVPKKWDSTVDAQTQVESWVSSADSANSMNYERISD